MRVDQLDVRIDDREAPLRRAPEQIGRAAGAVVEQLSEVHGRLQVGADERP
jgi:hypothetical protein